MRVMKLSNRILLLLVTLLSLTFASCDDDDGYSLGNFVARIATVKIESGVSYIQADDQTTLLPIAGYFPSSRLVDGERIAINYTLLYDNFQGYDHAIKVNNFYKVLTKPVELIETEEDDKKYGDDVVWVYDMWIGGNYLNVHYAYPYPLSERHRVSLVKNEWTETEDDGYVHLEYRYNAQGDLDNPEVQNLMFFSFVSFNLSSIDLPVDSKGLKIKINSAKNGHKILTFERSQAEDNKSIDFEEGSVSTSKVYSHLH